MHEITGVGGNADEFFVVCEAGRQHGKPAVRTTVYFTHEEMVQLLADYRQHHPMEGQTHPYTVFEEGKYRARTPADFGLRWSDAAHLTNLAANVLTNAMVGLFGIGIAIDEVPGMFGRYAR